MAAAGYAVHRVPAFSVGGVHYTYTNMVLCNGLALVPSYTNATVAPYNAQALGAWQTALQDHTIVPIDCQAIVTAAGVMHCIVMHVPAALGGAVPEQPASCSRRTAGNGWCRRARWTSVGTPTTTRR